MSAKIYNFPINDFKVWEMNKKHLIIIMQKYDLDPYDTIFWEIAEEAYCTLPQKYTINEWVEVCELLCDEIKKYGTF